MPTGTEGGLYDKMNVYFAEKGIRNFNDLSKLDKPQQDDLIRYFNSIPLSEKEKTGMLTYYGAPYPNKPLNYADIQKVYNSRVNSVKGLYEGNIGNTPLNAPPGGFIVPSQNIATVNNILTSQGLPSMSASGANSATRDVYIDPATHANIFVKQFTPEQLKVLAIPQQPIQPKSVPYSVAGIGYSDGTESSQGNGQLQEGGIQTGKGTAKSDSNPVVLAQGTVIIPVKHAEKALKIRKELGLLNKPFNNKDTSYDPKIWTSKGEVIFAPQEAELAKSKGYNLDELIEGDGTGHEFADGGEVNDKILDESNRTKLDGIVEQMIKNKEPEDNIKFVVNDFKDKYGVKKKVSEVSLSTSKESNLEVPSTSTELKTPSPTVTPNIQEVAPFVSKNDVKTVGQVKAEGGKPTFDNYLASAFYYPFENVIKVGEGLTQAAKSYVALNTPHTNQRPIAEQLKQQTGQALDTFKGLANAAFGVASLTPAGTAFNVVGENLPDTWQKIAFQPVTTLAKQFGYEPKEGDLGEKVLSTADIVSSLALMKGAEIGGKKVIGKGEFVPSTEELNQAMYDGLSDKIKEKKPLTESEIKVANNLIQTANPNEISKAIAQHSDKVNPQFSTENKMVDIIEKKKEGIDVKKDIAAFPDAKKFDDVLNISKEGGHIDDKTIDALKKDYVDVQNAKAKVLPEHRDNPEIVGLVAEKTNLEESKKNVDDSFHPAIDAKIDLIKEQIDNITNPLKTKENAIQEQSASGLLQYPQEGVGKTGGERGGMESGKQGIEPSREGTSTQSTQPSNEANSKTQEKTLTPPENKVVIVRHAETIDDVQNKVSGQNDAALTPEGKKEADRAAQEIKDHGIEKIIASPLTRTKQTADIIAKEDNIPIEHSENLKAWDLGKFTESPEKDFNEEYYVNHPNEKIPGGESFNDFKDRIVAEYNKIAKESNGKVAVVTHSKNMKLWDALEKNDGIWNEKAKEYYLSKENVVKPAEVQVKGNEEVKRTEFVKNKTKELQSLTDDEYIKQFIDQGHLNSINANMDFGIWPDFGLKTADIKKGIEDINNGKESAASRNLKEAILSTKANGVIPMIEGVGGMTNRFNVPLAEFHEEKPIELKAEEIDALAKEYDDYFNSLTEEQKRQEYEHLTESIDRNSKARESQASSNIKEIEKNKGEIHKESISSELFNELDNINKKRTINKRKIGKEDFLNEYGDDANKAIDINSNLESYIQKMKDLGEIIKIKC